MLFTSLQYVIFLPLIVAAYWVCPKKWRLPLLLAASYYFYMSWMPVFILLILGMTAFNFFWGQVLEKSTEPARKKSLFTIGIVANLLCLGFFKYTNFLLESVAQGVGLVTHHAPTWHADIILPLGISFFTFEFIHYLFEIYRGGSTIKSFVLFALFAAFFPTQIAGPIKRYKDFEEQMLSFPKFKLSHLDEGVPLIIVGLAKKLLLADNLAMLVDMGMKDPRVYGAPELCFSLMHSHSKSILIFQATPTSVAAVRCCLDITFQSISTCLTSQKTCRTFGIVGTFLSPHGCAITYSFR